MSATGSTHVFDVDALRRGIQERDAGEMSDLYLQDARLTLIDQCDQPGNAREIAGRSAIGEFLEELCGRDMEQHLEEVVVAADGRRAAYLERGRYPDDTTMIRTSMLNLRDGKIASQTSLQVWDEPAADETGAQTTAAQQVEHLDFSQAHEIRNLGAHAEVEVLHTRCGAVSRFTLLPGWSWSGDVRPVARTEWCQSPHFQYHVSGTLHIRMVDGTEFDAKAGDLTVLAPGHDTWVIGDEPVVLVNWQGALH